MPLSPDEVDADTRQEEGRRAALIAAKIDGDKVERKEFGQTSPEVYPYTYWFVKGWNRGVDELAAQS